MMKRIKTSLDSAGLTVWVDSELEVGSQSWKKDIENALRSSQFFVVILSPDAKQSKWVGCEITVATWLNLPIFPVLIRGDNLEAVPFDLVESNWVDLRMIADISAEIDQEIQKNYDTYFREQIAGLVDDIRVSLPNLSIKNTIESSLTKESELVTSSEGALVEEALKQFEQNAPDEPSSTLPVVEGGSHLPLPVETTLMPEPFDESEKPTSENIPHAAQVETASDKSQESANSGAASQPTTGKTVDESSSSGKQEDGRDEPIRSYKFLINAFIIVACLILLGFIIGTVPISSEAITIQLTWFPIAVPAVMGILSTLGILKSPKIQENLNNSYLWPLVSFGVLLFILYLINNLPFIQLQLLNPLNTRILPNTSAPTVSGIEQLSAYSFHPILNMSEDGWYLIECPQKPSETVGCWVPSNSDDVVIFGNRRLIKIITPSPTPSPPRTYTTSRSDVTAYDRPGGNKLSDLLPNFPYDLLGISPDRAWYVIRLTSGSRAWVNSSLTYGKINMDSSELEVIPTPTDDSTNLATSEAPQTFAAQTAIAETGTAASLLGLTAEAATATYGATSTALILTVTAHGYNTATREAANSVLTATRFAEDVLATYAAAFTQTAQANEQATQTAIVLTDSQHTAVAQAQTQVAQAITQTAEAFTDTPTPVPTPMGVCSGQWQRVNSGQPDEFFICDSLVTTEEYLILNPLVIAPDNQPFYPEARQDSANAYCEKLALSNSFYKYQLPNYDQWQSALSQGNIHPSPTYDREWLWSVPNNNTNSYEGMVYENGWQHRTNLPLIPIDRDWIYFRCVAVPKPG